MLFRHSGVNRYPTEKLGAPCRAIVSESGDESDEIEYAAIDFSASVPTLVVTENEHDLDLTNLFGGGPTSVAFKKEHDIDLTNLFGGGPTAAAFTAAVAPLVGAGEGGSFC
jgi:hypothetical protein